MGIAAAAVGGLSDLFISAGIGADIAGSLATGLTGALTGAGIGAGGAALTGGNPLTGALTGGLTGGAIGGFGSTVGDALGIGATGGDALVGAGAGALSSGLTGGNPLTGGLEGGAGGLASGLLSGSGGSAAPSAPGGGAASALSAAPDFTAPGAGAGGDLTGGLGGTDAGLGTSQGLTGGGSGGSLSGLSAPSSATVNGFSGPIDQLSLVSSNTTGDLGSTTNGAPAPGGTGGVDNTITGDTPVSPTSSLPSWLGGGGSAAPGNLGSMLNPDGTYVLPPGPSVDPGSSVVAPGGGILSPGSPGYDQAAASISATPQVTPAAGSGGGSLFGGISNGQLLGAGIAGTGLLYDITQKNSIPGESNISNLSNQLNSQSAQLQSYVTNGTLPPGVGQVLSQVQKSMTDQIKAKYAQLGMSGSTGEQQDIDNAALQVQSQGATEALNLMNQGVSLTQLSAQLMTTLLNSNTQQNQQTVSSISNLASALAGGGQTVRLQAAA